MTALRTRRPTGAAPWPRVLLSGEEGTDAAWMAAAFSADPRLVATYWLELVPGSIGDVYAAAPGSDYELLDHDGTWEDIYGQVDAAWETARAVAEDGGPPSALVVNGMSAEWAMLSELADRRARRRTAAALIERGMDPAPAYSSEMEVEIGPDLWTLIGTRHRRLMGKILTWPGPVILTAREKRDRDGRWVLKAQDQLGFDVTAWVRLTRHEKPEIVSLLTPKRRLNSAQRRALRTQFSLSTLVWEWCGCTPSTELPAVRLLDADQTMPGEEPPVRPVAVARTAGPRPMPPPPTSAAPAPREGNEPVGAVVLSFTDRWLALDAREMIQDLFAEMTAAGAAVESADVAGFLTVEERAALGVAEGVALSLRELAIKAGRNIHTTGSAIRSPRQAGAA